MEIQKMYNIRISPTVKRLICFHIGYCKIDKNHSYAFFPYKNNHIFYDYSEINRKGPPVRKTWLKLTKHVLLTQTYYMLCFVQIKNNRYENRLIFLLYLLRNIKFAYGNTKNVQYSYFANSKKINLFSYRLFFIWTKHNI
jgi:hypothetical protein